MSAVGLTVAQVGLVVSSGLNLLFAGEIGVACPVISTSSVGRTELVAVQDFTGQQGSTDESGASGGNSAACTGVPADQRSSTDATRPQGFTGADGDIGDDGEYLSGGAGQNNELLLILYV